MLAEHAVWTVGHSNHDFDRFARLLLPERIEFLIDVRSFPYSRYAPQFNREPLAAAIARHGVRYVFMGEELGGRPKHEEHYDANGHALYAPMSEESLFRDAIKRLIAGASRHRLALLCSEADPQHCHRRLLVGRVLTERAVHLRHILPDASVSVEDAVTLPHDPAQGSLLGEEDPRRSTRSVSHRRRLSASSTV